MKTKAIVLFVSMYFISIGLSSVTAQTCVLTAKQFLSLTHANTDLKESLLFPCFHMEDDVYRRDYASSSAEYQNYDIIGFDGGSDYDGEEAWLHTTSVETYTKYKNALKTFGFTLDESVQVTNSTVYQYNSYTMQTVISKNSNKNTVYAILLYKRK